MREENREEYQEVERRPRKKKKSHKLYAAIVLTLGIVILTLTVFILFYVQKIEVKGNQYCSDKEIAESVQNDSLSINSIYVLAKYKMGRGEVLPCLDKISVSMKNPWTLRVTVEEKQPVGYMNVKKERVYFDKDGLVVLKGYAVLSEIPCVEGIKAKKITVYKNLEVSNKNIFKEILKTSQELKKNELVSQKIVCKGNEIYVYVENVQVALGTTVTAEKVAQIKPIVQKLDGKEGTLHLENYTIGNETITFTTEKFQEEK